MKRKLGAVVVVVCALAIAPGVCAAESWNLFRSFGIVAVPELSGLDALAPVAVISLIGCAGYGIRAAYGKIARRKSE